MINVLQLRCSSGLYGAEMWIVALGRYLPPEQINCRLAVTTDSETRSVEVVNRFRALGLPVHRIGMRGRFDPRVIAKLVHLIKAERIDIIHTHGYKSDLLGLIASRIAGIKALATPHGFENVKDIKLQSFIWIGCRALKFFDAVAPLSEELVSDMQKIGVPAKKVRLIKNGLDLAEIEAERLAAADFPRRTGIKRIGYVGQMAYRKNIGDLLRAFDQLYREHKDVHLVLIGDGPNRKELENQVQIMGLKNQVEFLGYRQDRLGIVKNLDLFCMTSSLEGIPRCMMEAMALEVPVAAFNIPGVDKLIIQRKTGLMAPFGDVKELKNCMERMLFDEELSKKVARNGRRYVTDNFSAQRMAEEYIKLYQELVGA